MIRDFIRDLRRDSWPLDRAAWQRFIKAVHSGDELIIYPVGAPPEFTVIRVRRAPYDHERNGDFA